MSDSFNDRIKQAQLRTAALMRAVSCDKSEIAHQRDMAELLKRLRRLVREYRPQIGHGPLPSSAGEPELSFRSIGIIYDEDTDDRVLIAIEQLKQYRRKITAVGEHEGELTVYTHELLPIGDMINVGHDCWTVSQLLPWVPPFDAKFSVEWLSPAEYKQREEQLRAEQRVWQRDFVLRMESLRRGSK